MAPSRQQTKKNLISPTGIASAMFVIGGSRSRGQGQQPQAQLEKSLSEQLDLPELSSQATIGRNSQFRNLTAEDREHLGGVEYRSLKLLLKIVIGRLVYRPVSLTTFDNSRSILQSSSLWRDLLDWLDPIRKPEISKLSSRMRTRSYLVVSSTASSRQ